MNISFLLNKIVVIYSNKFPTFCIKGTLGRLTNKYWYVSSGDSYTYFELDNILCCKTGHELGNNYEQDIYYILVESKII